MKKISGILFFLFMTCTCTGQKIFNDFNAVIRSGSSEQAFAFVRNSFGLTYTEDPFLHFKERGIKKLVSFCSYGDRRIEATSLIKFNQTKEFWHNYSQQFTAGKWNYKTLYPTDSLAWEAANYSITLIYAHEMGHYMSFRYINPERSSYTCEELVANECLTAFANLFNGNQKFDKHKKLFIELCAQTAAAIPDSNKTDFQLPMTDWCKPSPMDDFFKYFETDEDRFLRLYGYLQFKMMETLLTTSTENLTLFAARRFTDFFKKKTGNSFFKPLRYTILKEENLPQIPFTRFIFNKMDAEPCYKTYFYSNAVMHLDNQGDLYSSETVSKNIFPDTPYNDPASDLEQITIWNSKLQSNKMVPLQGLTILDSVKNINVFTFSAYKTAESYWYLLKQIKEQYSYRQLMADNTNTDSLTQLPSTSTHQFYYLQPKANNIIAYKHFELPDSLSAFDNVHYRDLNIAGFNNYGALLINNEYRKDEQHRITVYPVDTSELILGNPLIQFESKDSSFYNMELPSCYIKRTTNEFNLAFFNPVTEKIHLLRVNEKGLRGFELQPAHHLKNNYPKLKITAMRMIAHNKMYVVAQCRKPGNASKLELKRFLLQW